jgi:hypothetical protein
MSYGARIAFGVILIGGLAAAYLMLRVNDGIDRGICTQRYAAARTRNDSAAVDATVALRERWRATSEPIPTCGELRRLDSLAAHKWSRIGSVAPGQAQPVADGVRRLR